ncbi:MAG: glycosyl hydrolase family 18 protein, partial [bacterium]|nr:glycosyl hydrolase family 18 protein [bacterium]
VTTAKEYGFSGVVLDLELSALPFDSLVKQVSSFAEAFAKDTSQNNLDFAMILYGDTFYRVRPFDLKTLAKIVPSFYVMAYDFHKAGGNPGPNFPFSGKETYGYDYQTMVDNFLEYVSPEKLTIIYGMYGYDWEIGNNGKAVGDGQAKSLLQIKTSIIDRCEMLRCKITHDTDASETTLTYTDNEHKKHVVWFEDEQSLKKKETFAKTMGISKFSYWAYSYF